MVQKLVLREDAFKSVSAGILWILHLMYTVSLAMGTYLQHLEGIQRQQTTIACITLRVSYTLLIRKFLMSGIRDLLLDSLRLFQEWLSSQAVKCHLNYMYLYNLDLHILYVFLDN